MTPRITALIMAAAAYSFISVGFILQKKGISWIGWKGRKDRSYFKNLGVWTAGFILMNGYGIPSAVALTSLPPHIVSAFAGWGIIVLVFLSHLFLRETVRRSDFFYSLAVIGGIVLMNISEPPVQSETISADVPTILFFATPLSVFLCSLILLSSDKLKNFFYALVSGCSAGMMVISLKGLVQLHEYRLTEYPGSVYLYLYIFYAVLSFVSLQISLRTGPVMITGQIQYSMTIIYPYAGLLIVFSGETGVLQPVSIGLITWGVVKMVKNR